MILTNTLSQLSNDQHKPKYLKNTTPTVSVFVTTRNRCDLLFECINSILKQTFSDLEVVIVDDNSSDSTSERCQELTNQDQRVRYIRNYSQLGMVTSANIGLDACRGEFVARLDDDNRWLPTFLEQSVAFLRSETIAGFVFSDEWIISYEGVCDMRESNVSTRRYGRDQMHSGVYLDTELLAARQTPPINATLFRHEVLCAVDGFTSSLSAGLDCDLFLKLAALKIPVGYFTDRLTEYRIHQGMSTVDRLTNQKKAEDNIFMWKRQRFSGAAEQERRCRLAAAYCSLGRVQLLHGEIDAARDSVAQACQTAPTSLRYRAIQTLLQLPKGLIQHLLNRRYNTVLVPQSPLAGHPQPTP